MTKTKENQEKTLTIAQQAGYARRKLKNRGIDALQDHRGREVPVDYVPDIDLLKHFETLEIIECADTLKMAMAAFKYKVQEKGDLLYEQLLAEDNIRDGSIGGFTLATFDKTLKIIYAMDSVKEKIPEELKMAENHWKQFIDDKFSEQVKKDIGWLIDMVDDMLHNAKDELDIRLIGKLNRMAGRLKNKHYTNFLKHLNQAYDTRHTKRYEQFKRRNDQGEYDSIVLTYSSITPEMPADE